ncbi:dTDP-glucose 4,6-dehydratase [Alishewanella sp. SMS8]|uniref:dTDP-glucose 4,6-dehydratase n=1 Tax=Alishewanella sp. SMS8 TaxID=2994676 RepID=UPI002742471B|nr:dTDP-glucose 4,6-dehydratase [Alishewanella sp. SMS8]MDP5460124.1 dTDP-glucose 4,6-dehydratase [Alishewanella sp. SMS8]
MNKCVFVTGGSGFIGSAVVRLLLATTDFTIVNIDKLSYAANPLALKTAEQHPRYVFKQLDIIDEAQLHLLFAEYQPQYVIHLAAESHVDRSINIAAPFIQSNIVGTFSLLEACRKYWAQLPVLQQQVFRLLHVSTDEVYGDIPLNAHAATEQSAYHPSSPYSASKAASDHLVQAWQRTYGLPVLISHCTNNYGPFQHQEKLIPLVINRALEGQPLPIYGDGQQIRDWLFVEDHAKALLTVLQKGTVGESYNISANNQLTNLEVVSIICHELDKLIPASKMGINHYNELITFVADRPGHDRRYALDATKITQQLGWQPSTNFAEGIVKTITAYLP